MPQLYQCRNGHHPTELLNCPYCAEKTAPIEEKQPVKDSQKPVRVPTDLTEPKIPE